MGVDGVESQRFYVVEIFPDICRKFAFGLVFKYRIELQIAYPYALLFAEIQCVVAVPAVI